MHARMYIWPVHVKQLLSCHVMSLACLCPPNWLRHQSFFGQSIKHTMQLVQMLNMAIITLLYVSAAMGKATYVAWREFGAFLMQCAPKDFKVMMKVLPSTSPY